MYKKHLAILLSISMLLFLISTNSSGQEVERLTVGQYAENGDFIVFYSPIPLTKGPDVSYGRRGDNARAENTLEDVSIAIEALLKSIKNEKGWPALRTIVFNFDRITIEKYKWTDYELVRQQILDAFDLTKAETKSD